MEPLVIALMTWVSGVTGLPAPATPPAVRYAPQANIQATALLGVRRHRPALVAYYISSRSEIVLPAGWDASNPFYVSILVHELVHHLQAHAFVEYACPAAREKPAYDAQKAWLASQSLDLFNNDVFYIN
jgi:hypothetical protein